MESTAAVPELAVGNKVSPLKQKQLKTISYFLALHHSACFPYAAEHLNGPGVESRPWDEEAGNAPSGAHGFAVSHPTTRYMIHGSQVITGSLQRLFRHGQVEVIAQDVTTPVV